MESSEFPPKLTVEESQSPERRGSVSSTLLPSATNTGRPRSSTSSVFLNFIQNGSSTNVSTRKYEKGKFLSLYRVLLLELNLPGPEDSKKRSEQDIQEEERAYELLTNMTKVPLYLEKFIAFGLLVCLNSFLTLFTLVPMKICLICYSAIAEFVHSPSKSPDIVTRKLHFVKRDIIILLLIVSSVAVLGTPALEVSRLYHDIRGQAHIKLYVMFGVLEVADKLLSSLSHEIFTVLVGILVTNTTPQNLGKLVFFSLIALFFSACHSYVLIYQSVSLHVAANSYSNALLALLLSNQFAELKGAVFKKFEREGLFQIAMSDLTERFQLSVMLFVIAIRNLSQLSITELALVPDSWKSWNKWFGAIFGPSVVVLGSEIFVDWVKHCFVIKFNRIKPRVYDNFLYVLSLDFMEVFTSHSKGYTLHEVSDYVILTKRIGLPIMSLSVCLLRMSLRDLKVIYLPSTYSWLAVIASAILIALTFVALLVTRLLLGLWLLKWARHIKIKHERFQQALKAASTPLHQYEKTSIVADVIPEVDSPASPASGNDAGTESLSSGHSNFVYRKADHNTRTPEPALSPTEDSLSPADIPFQKYRLPDESDSEIESSFLPGIPNTESSSINPTTRSHLFDYGEKVPPTLEEKRNAQFRKRHLDSPITSADARYDTLNRVQRYEMSSKRIW